MAMLLNQYGVVNVGLMSDGIQYKRSVALLVAQTFIPRPFGPFDTPINLNGSRLDNRVENLMWRPRWYAVKYNRQFEERFRHHIPYPIKDLKTGELTENSLACAMRYGLLEKDIVLAILNHTYVWPTYQMLDVAQ